MKNQTIGNDSFNTSSIAQAEDWADEHDFSVFSFNANLNAKKREINDFVKKTKPTIVIVSEVGIPKWKLNEECPFRIDKYTGPEPESGFHSGKLTQVKNTQGEFYNIKASNSPKGGVAMWIRNDDNPENLTMNNITNELDVGGGSESKVMNYCVLEINSQSPSYQLIVTAIYKSPSNPYKSFCPRFSNLINRLKERYGNSPMLVAGDFNYDILDAENADASNYLELLESFGFVQHIDKPTHIIPTKASCLDHIMTNFKINEADVVEHNISDHKVTMAAWNLPLEQLSPTNDVWLGNTFLNRKFFQ